MLKMPIVFTFYSDWRQFLERGAATTHEDFWLFPKNLFTAKAIPNDNTEITNGIELEFPNST
ncbi:hypothetical protein G3A_14885 [Bacillus sp. 17376]|uniref:Uncharacterized protein n=1 Tax=Mesobacillus boroniphilus JCM 21738 TaxID=1294265 RepID=W4RU35_9BACI|nr:hypothetical protein [Mesobacillus boroniphilus]ESU31741.1 hypothetical protein G3A_14885 [Bacillus sp. 17376]GAE47164.1 hypothetical protein JCM21738_4114 [Mesobacillus boroniphilus JCM 21738]